MSKTKYKFNQTFQENIVSLIIRDDGIAHLKSIIYPEYFGDPTLREISFRAMAFRDKYRQPPSSAEFRAFLKKEGVEVNVRNKAVKLLKSDISNPQFVIDAVVEFAQHSALKEALLDSADMVEGHEDRFKVRNRIAEAMNVGTNITEVGINLVDGLNDRIVERMQHGLYRNKVSTGLKRLDEFTSGGLDAGELGIVMAPPKGFKTGVLLNFGAAAVAQRKKVLVITLEISEKNMTMRYERRVSGLTKAELVTKVDKLRRAMKKITRVGGALLVKEFPMKSATVDDIRNHVQLVSAQGFVPDMIIVDYLGLVKPKDGKAEVRHQLGNIGADLRAMAQELQVPVWTAMQVNRKAVSKKVIHKDDIAESFDVVAVSDLGIAVCQTKEERAMEPSNARLFIAWNREDEGEKLIYTSIDYSRMRVKQLADQFEDEEAGE